MTREEWIKLNAARFIVSEAEKITIKTHNDNEETDELVERS